MKTSTSLLTQFTRDFQHRHPRLAEQQGFALLVTLSMMVLLALLAVGLLSLSTVSLRASSQGNALSIAQANARMGMMQAMGQLQKLAGPDKRVTATGAMLDDKANHPNLTGVWESWKIDPNQPPAANEYQSAAKKERFLGWLASNENVNTMTNEADFPAAGKFSDSSVVNLVPAVGTETPAVEAGKVKITDSGNRGAYAWAVLDEGVKARLNTTTEQKASELPGSQTMALGSGRRAAVERMNGLEALDSDNFELSGPNGGLVTRTISRATGELFMKAVGSSDENSIRDLSHDLTFDSAGLMTDVANGGLKTDLNNMLSGSALPPEFAGMGIYESLFEIDAPFQPNWAQIHDYANYYKKTVTNPGIESSGGAPKASARAPRNWSAALRSRDRGRTGNIPNIYPPDGVVLMPTIAKVQMVFTLVARDMYHYPKGSRPPKGKTQQEQAVLHAPWGRYLAGSDYNYLLHLVYTPIVTLHNPYNVTLDFSSLKVDFVNIPMALQIFRNGAPQMSGLVPVTQMFGSTESGGKSKRFSMTLQNAPGSAGSKSLQTVSLLPGEVKVFSPYIPPTVNWASEVNEQKYFFDFRNENASEGRAGSHVDTSKIVGIPGWTGEAIGYDADWLAPPAFRVSSVETENGVSMTRNGVLPVKATDQIHIEFSPKTDPIASDNRFQIEMSLDGVRGTATMIEFDYESPEGLEETILDGGQPIRYPKEGTISGLDLVDHSTSALRDYEYMKPFALFSAYAKTSFAELDESPDDGRNASMPWAFHHAVGPAASQKVLSGHPAHHSHEINLERLDGTTADNVQIDAMNRGNFITGHTSYNGRKFGVLYELPLAPAQTMSAFNSANLAGGALPRFAQPIGNSWASPLLPTDSLSAAFDGEQGYDHSFLLNLGLYDQFYFSGFSDHDGLFIKEGDSEQIVRSFFEQVGSLDDPRFTPWTGGMTVDDVIDAVTNPNDGFKQAAAHQLFKGAFNVNSTSVEAWKAMLSSIQSEGAIQNLHDARATKVRIVAMDEPAKDSARFSRLRLPSSESINQSTTPEQALWMGARDLNPDQIEKLAIAIVREVRERGPFLSMGEFVNRQLGPSSDLSLKGALQAAIDTSGVNEEFNDLGGYDITLDRVSDDEYATPEAMAGASARGAPGMLSQSDLLTALGNAATVRSDTFRIRAYGEAIDSSGRVLASARCEAIVQRVPEYLNPRNHASARDNLEPENDLFGRKFIIQSFRWLQSNEV